VSGTVCLLLEALLFKLFVLLFAIALSVIGGRYHDVVEWLSGSDVGFCCARDAV